MDYLLVSLSNTPSPKITMKKRIVLLDITIKSWSFVILKDFISGVAITTLEFPPHLGYLA